MRYFAVLFLIIVFTPFGFAQNLDCELQELAFVGDSELGHRDIFVASLQDLEGINITQDDVDELFPRWSPDGNRITFVAMIEPGWSELMLIDATGNNRESIHRQSWIYLPEWSPTGELIAFTALANEQTQARGLYVIDTDTYFVTRLDGDWQPEIFSWSSDGAYLAVQGRDTEGIRAIYLVNVATQETRRLTEPYTLVSEPTWTQDNLVTFAGEASYTVIDPFDEDAYLTHSLPLSNITTLLWSPVDGEEDALVLADDDIWHFSDDSLLNLTQDADSVRLLTRSPDGMFAAYLNQAFQPEFRLNVRVLNIMSGEILDFPSSTDMPDWRPCLSS